MNCRYHRPARLGVLVMTIILATGIVWGGAAARAEALEGRDVAALVEEGRILLSAQGGSVPLALSDEVIEFYRGRNFLPVWHGRNGLRRDAETLLEQLRAAPEQGLCGEDYYLAGIERQLAWRRDQLGRGLDIPPAGSAALELLLTQSFFSFGNHLLSGRVDPQLTHVDWLSRRRSLDLGRLLPSAVEGDSLKALLAEVAPPHSEYRALVKALAEYRALAARGGWPFIPGGEKLVPGDIDARLPAVRARLLVTGELPAPLPYEGNAYGPGTLAAVKRFQERHGLEPDGVIGKRTLEALNVSVEGRIRQIELNLERWRWLVRDLGRRHIRINIADYHLDLFVGGKVVLSMPVIVGRPYRRTPVFSSQMSYLEFAPTWTVPPTILREDKLPAIKKNPKFLRDNHFQVVSAGRALSDEALAGINWKSLDPGRFPGELRMSPGPWNPLGRVKFMFPNPYNVYLHDTNERGLFSRTQRTFSSGCIRIGKPVDLARYLLKDIKGWDEERLQQALARTTPLQVNIDPLPTHIQYWTAWVAADGSLQLRNDLYHRDLDLEVALSGRESETRGNIAAPERRVPSRVASGG